MARQILSHLLTFWLLLSQLPKGLLVQRMDEVITLCGRELAREWIATCGMVGGSFAGSKKQPRIRSRSLAEVVSSSINKDAETINMMSEFIPNLPQELKATLSERQPSLTELQRLFIPELESLQLIFEEYKKMVQAQTEAGKNHLLQLKDLGLSKHSRKKRQYSIILSHGCCKLGCTRRVLARACST